MPVDLDAALDSAGYVAAVRYGDYRWSTEQYYDLVTSRRWAWHAAMDFCCEPPVAGALVVRIARLEATALGYLRCVNEAKKRQAPSPMPVLQGWFPQDYERCADMLAIQEWPDLVGIGSVCRRNVGGPDGISTIIETLDRVLPSHVKFHLFGVKGGAVKDLGSHPRFASIDSMAWDYAVRCQSRTGRTQSMRVNAMIDWQHAQAKISPQPWVNNVLFGSPARPVRSTPMPMEQMVHEIVAAWYADNLLACHGYRDTIAMAQQQANMICMQIDKFGLSSLQDSTDSVDVAVYEILSI
jgi:hypothetical protein